MLLVCKECSGQVSDKAWQCPHCGLPMKNTTRGKLRKRKKLPNGFGRITKISANTKKPYRAMVTVGKDENGRPIGKLLKPIAYFETYNAAYEALLLYHKKPYSIDENITVKEVYERWSNEYFKHSSRSAMYQVKSAFKYCHTVHNERMRDIRIRHIKYCIEEGSVVRKSGTIKRPSKDMQERIKVMWNQMFDYALEYDLTDKNYAREYKKSFAPTVRRTHLTYSDEEMKILWENKDDYIAGIILIQCYSGLRPAELLSIKKKNIDLDNNTMIGGLKTASGKDRIIPIHPLIKPLIEKYMKNGYETLIEPMPYEKLRRLYRTLVEERGLKEDHKLHDGRKHFVTLAKKYKVDDFAIKRIVGHAISDITEKTYTERPAQWLVSEISKIEQY